MNAVAEEWLKAPVAEEFNEAELGDPRRTRRLKAIAARSAEAPEVGFPQLVADDSELEGLYRFLNNPRVGADAIVQPQIEASLRRARECGLVLMVHDTTDFSFGGRAKRQGLGPVHGQQQGFLGHFALAVAPGPARIPLGVVGLLRNARKQ